MRRVARIGALCTAAAGVLLARAASADIYEYTDSDGVVHYTNTPRAGGDRPFRVFLRTSDSVAGTARSGADVVPARDASPERFARFDGAIREAATLYLIPEALIRAVIAVESDYDPRVVSAAGAQGLMQLMPVTARRMGVADPFDPRQNILGGTRFLRILANLFGGDLVLTIAAYNAGEESVVRAGGIPPIDATRRYVEDVLRSYYALRSQAASAVAGPRTVRGP